MKLGVGLHEVTSDLESRNGFPGGNGSELQGISGEKESRTFFLTIRREGKVPATLSRSRFTGRGWPHVRLSGMAGDQQIFPFWLILLQRMIRREGGLFLFLRSPQQVPISGKGYRDLERVHPYLFLSRFYMV